MQGHIYCPEGRIQKEGFLPFFIQNHDYGEEIEYDPTEENPFFKGINNKLIYKCRSKSTIIPSHASNVSDTVLLYDQSKDFKLFGVKNFFNFIFYFFFFTFFFLLFIFFFFFILFCKN